MTKSASLYSFFSGFGLDAYPVSSVPEDVTLPYLTYDNTVGCSGDPSVSINVNLWYHTDSEATPNAKAEEIAEAIGKGGKQIACDDGSIWIKRGQPWCLALSDQSDPQIKRRQMNVELEFL